MSDNKIMTPEEFKEWYAKSKGYIDYKEMFVVEVTNIDLAEDFENRLMQSYAEYFHEQKESEEIELIKFMLSELNKGV